MIACTPHETFDFQCTLLSIFIRYFDTKFSGSIIIIITIAVLNVRVRVRIRVRIRVMVMVRVRVRISVRRK